MHETTAATYLDVLPIPDRTQTDLVTSDAKDATTSFPSIEQLRPPQGAPNIMVVMLDDVAGDHPAPGNEFTGAIRCVQIDLQLDRVARPHPWG